MGCKIRDVDCTIYATDVCLALSAFGLAWMGRCRIEVGVVACATLGFVGAVGGICLFLRLGLACFATACRIGGKGHGLLSLRIKAVDEVGAPDAFELTNDARSFFGFIPKEEHALTQFLLRGVR